MSDTEKRARCVRVKAIARRIKYAVVHEPRGYKTLMVFEGSKHAKIRLSPAWCKQLAGFLLERYR